MTTPPAPSGVPGIPGVGVSFGVDRIYDVMEELKPVSPRTSGYNGTKVLFFNLGEARESRAAFELMQATARKKASPANSTTNKPNSKPNNSNTRRKKASATRSSRRTRRINQTGMLYEGFEQPDPRKRLVSTSCSKSSTFDILYSHLYATYEKANPTISPACYCIIGFQRPIRSKPVHRQCLPSTPATQRDQYYPDQPACHGFQDRPACPTRPSSHEDRHRPGIKRSGIDRDRSAPGHVYHRNQHRAGQSGLYLLYNSPGRFAKFGCIHQEQLSKGPPIPRSGEKPCGRRA